MITPAFELSQDPQYLILSIRVPYTRTSDFDLYIDGTDFKFYAKPYFLRLSLPGRIVEDGREKATFDIDKGLFTLHVPKETAGEHFEGLHMLTSLLAPKGSRSAQPLVEDISMGACAEEEEDEEEFDWQVEQEVYMESSEAELGVLQKYGFGNQRSGVFTRLQEELSDVIDVKNPEGTTAAERRQARECTENSAFCSDHYLADLFEDEEIQRLLRFRPWWTELSCSLGQEGEEAAVCFTDDEKDQLRKFTNRSYLLDKSSRQHTWLSLLDILLAYAYEVRSTEGEHNVESPWTIRKLSGTLCWLETYSSMQEVLVSFGRRVLCFPLYRHFDLISAAVRDTARILQSGKACVLKCLLDIHKIFRENDPAYILNDLYITDYCIWIQRVKSRKVTALAGPLQKTSRCKKDLGLELEELEQAAAMVEKEEDEEQRRSRSNNVPQTLAGDSSSSSSSSSSDSSSSSSSSSDSSEEESDDSEADRQGCTRSAEGGGGGKGGERAKASPPPHPLQPRPLLHAASSPTTTAAPLPSRLPTPPTTVTPSAAGRKPDPLIQELGEQVAEELWISRQAQPLAGHAGDDERSATERSCSQLTTTTAVSSSSSAETFLELCPRRNPLLVVKTDSDLDEDDIIG